MELALRDGLAELRVLAHQSRGLGAPVRGQGGVRTSGQALHVLEQLGVGEAREGALMKGESHSFLIHPRSGHALRGACLRDHDAERTPNRT
jgi:hypothetical protein